MYLCLSSGHSVRYRLDVLRALSMPAGAYLQFRYDLKYVAPGVRVACEKGLAVQQRALIAYIDQANKSRPPEIVPVRFATIKDVLILGTTVSIRLCLEQFAHAEQLEAFNNEVNQTSAGTTPRLQSDAKVKGCYWVDLNTEPRTVTRSATLLSWQEIVGQLVAHEDFASEDFFISVADLKRHRWGKSRTVNPSDGHFVLDSARDYSLLIYQFHPQATPKNGTIQLTSSAATLQIISDASIAVDSRYDHKQVILKTSALLDEEHVRLRLLCGSKDTTIDGLYFDLPCIVKGGRISAIFYASVLAASLAAPNLMALFANPNISRALFPYAIAVTLIASILAAVIAVFRVRKLF